MKASETGVRQLITGAGGVLLIVSLFLPWADFGGESRSGWELWTMADLLFLFTGAFGIWAAITGGRFGLLRADLSLSGAADLLGVVATILIAWLIFFDFPAGAGREAGVFLALISAATISAGVGVYRRPPGGWFPRMA